MKDKKMKVSLFLIALITTFISLVDYNFAMATADLSAVMAKIQEAGTQDKTVGIGEVILTIIAVISLFVFIVALYYMYNKTKVVIYGFAWFFILSIISLIINP